MTPEAIQVLTDPAEIRARIHAKELALRNPMFSRQGREEIHRDIAALEERHLEITGEEWRT